MNIETKDIQKKPIKMSIEEAIPEPEKKAEETKDKYDRLLVYPKDMRENFERMLSGDALNIDDIKKKRPDLRFRYLNKEWRMRDGRMGPWVKVDPNIDRPVGDLALGIVPTDLAIKRDEKRRKKECADLLGEIEFQEEAANKIHRDSEGTVRIYMDGKDKFAGVPVTKTYNVPAQIS